MEKEAPQPHSATPDLVRGGGVGELCYGATAVTDLVRGGGVGELWCVFRDAVSSGSSSDSDASDDGEYEQRRRL